MLIPNHLFKKDNFFELPSRQTHNYKPKLQLQTAPYFDQLGLKRADLAKMPVLCSSHSCCDLSM